MDDDPLLAYRARLNTAAVALARDHARRRRRRITLAAAVVAMLVAVTSTLAATGVVAAWIGGKPAPEDAKQDFAAIRTELGFTAEADAAVEVGQDAIPTRPADPGAASAGQIALYATPTRQGGYCLVARAPWLPFDGDGRGYCIKPEAAKRPLVAGSIGASGSDASGGATFIVAGRAQARGAATISFTDPNGQQVDRQLGPGAFFVAAITARIQTCFDGNRWWPEFTVADAQGRELLKATFPLWTPGRSAGGKPLPGTCGIAGPISDVEAARVIESEEQRIR